MRAKLLYLYLLLTLLPLAVAVPALSQEQQPLLILTKKFPVSSGTVVSIDRNGNIYFLDQRRNIVQLDSVGRPVTIFSPQVRGRISTINAWNPMKILAFYQDRQQLLLLDRFLRPISNAYLTDFNFEGTVRAAALSSDDSFWLFDETNFSLTKLDSRLRKVVSQTQLNLILDRERFDIRMVREYQNLVYLLDYNGGIYVFDNLGNYKKKLPYTGVSYISFRNNELYFVKDNKLNFLDLYTSQLKAIDVPAGSYSAALISGRQVYLFTNNTGFAFNW